MTIPKCRCGKEMVDVGPAEIHQSSGYVLPARRYECRGEKHDGAYVVDVPTGDAPVLASRG